uniref:Semaphorin-4E-like n=1 Tax=Mastacembelus armatus TaxID=205130 RepID=A0A3Q3LWL3_9TELE
MNLKQFKQSETNSRLSALLVRDDIGQLVVGARGKVFTLSLDDITKKTSEVRQQQKSICQIKGKDITECDNFIRTLHTMEDGKMLVCGTNAFNPSCDYMTFNNGKASLEGNLQEVFFSSNKYLHGPNPLKTEMKRSCLVEANKNSEGGDDDYVILFFTESAVEERHDNVRVSRIARVCKSDLGGKMTLQKKWTSFLKARFECPFGDVGSPTLVQDVFLVQDQNNWKDSIFYSTFTSNSKSAVCAYKLSDINQVFSGRFLTESDTGSWETYTGEEPFPHPGSCISNETRAIGVMTSLDFSDKTLLFVRNHPLMEGMVTPLTGKPLLVQTGTQFSKIVVDQVTSLDGQQHHIMLIGTDSGWLQKAVRFDGEDSRIIEELQLFQTPQSVNFLQLSLKSGQLYSTSSNIAVQINVRDCTHYTSCDDCLLARDPYCGWDQIRGQCASAVGTSTGIQSLTDGDISMCLTSDCKLSIPLGNTVKFLPCSPETNLPVSWHFSGSIHFPGPQHTVLSQGLIISPSYSDAGLYTCETVETVRGKTHRKTVVQYFVQVHDNNAVVRNLKTAVIALAAFTNLLLLMCSVFLIRHIKANKQNYSGHDNKNTNNNELITKRPFCHYDQTKHQHKEEEQPVQTGSVISILILPEGYMTFRTKNQTWTHQTKGQFSTDLKSIP